MLPRSVEEWLAPEPGRLWVTLTFAQSRDAKIAGPAREPLRLSGDASMAMTHALRAWHDGILVGIGTVLSDNPRLSVRLVPPPLPPVADFPRPIVLDGALRTPPTAALLELHAQGKGRQPLILCNDTHSAERRAALERAGAEVCAVGDTRDWAAVCAALHARGVTRLMIEGGAGIIDSALMRHAAAPLIDVCIVTEAPTAVGAGYGYSVSFADARLATAARVPVGPDSVVVLH